MTLLFYGLNHNIIIIRLKWSLIKFWCLIWSMKIGETATTNEIIVYRIFELWSL